MIYFVLCPAFHGATLLSLLLNNHGRVFALGDTNPTRAYDQTCACGEKVSDCDFWAYIAENIKFDPEENLPNLLPVYPRLHAKEKTNKAMNTALSVAARHLGSWLWILGGDPAHQFADRYRDFLDAASKWAPHDVFIDGEKSLLKYMVCASMGFPVGGVIHLTRDPRGYATSRMESGGTKDPAALAKEWADQHRRIELFGRLFSGKRYLRVRYEDLIKDPQRLMDRLFTFMGVGPEPVIGPPKDPRKHHLMGNKMLQIFTGEVKTGESWRKSMHPAHGESIAAAAEPLFSAYGYGVKD